MNNPSKNLKLAEQGTLLAIVTYILLSTAKLIAGSMLHSSSLTADGFNNISDIVANIAVLIRNLSVTTLCPYYNRRFEPQ